LYPAAAQTLHVPHGATKEIKGAHTFDEVIIEGQLILTGNTTLKVKQDMTVDTLGWIYCDVDGGSGEDGDDGTEVGARGKNGGDGTSGKDAHDLTLFIEGNLYLRGRITVNGGRAGNGGNGGNGAEGKKAVCCEGGSAAAGGGRGGHGGDGGVGGDGGALTVSCKGTIFHSDHGSLQANGGLGGTGGQGGLGRDGGGGCADPCYDSISGEFLYLDVKGSVSVTMPGKTGNAGKGGAGGKVLVWAKEIEADSGFISNSLAHASGGMGGHGGEGQAGTSGVGGGYATHEGVYVCYPNLTGKTGRRGSSGANGGAGGEIYVNTCTINRINGLWAAGGYGGNGGDSLVQAAHMGGGEHPYGGMPDCAFWREGLQGLDGAKAGTGGLGGHVKVETYTLGPYNLYTPGGQGGEGGNGGSFAGRTNCGLNDPRCSNINGRPADGGNGGPGSHGGKIELKYASFNELPPHESSVDVSPGAGGEGGDFGRSQIPWLHDVFGKPGLPGQAGQEGAFSKLRIVDSTLFVKLAASNGTVRIGQRFTYICGVTSPRLEQHNLQVKLGMPDECTLVKVTSVPSAKWSIQGGSLVWDIAKIKACHTFNFTVDLKVRKTGVPGVIKNRLSATTDQISGAVRSEQVVVKVLVPGGQ
jgi:hypothetical protein